MKKTYYLTFTLFIIFFVFLSLSPEKAEAVNYTNTLTNLKDTITTSRPSASSPITSAGASGVTQLTIADNKSRFLASDSAQVFNSGTGVIQPSVGTLAVASQSADLTKVYFNTATGAISPAGAGVLVSPVTAKHTITFTTSTLVPAGGFIYVNFPNTSGLDSQNAASPSASTFQFNGLATGNINISFSAGTTTCPTFTFDQASGATSHNIKCTVTTAAINPGTVVTITIGNTSPALINPTKVAAANTADIWTIIAQTQDSSNTVLDQGKGKIGTIESVQVQAIVDATFTFTINGVNTGAALNVSNVTGCTATDTTTAGVANATSTLVDLGFVGSANINTAAQRINITTNGLGGYSLVATSSGRLRDPGNGYFFPDSNGAAGSVMAAGTTWFGIRGCGLDANTTTFGSSANSGAAGEANVKFAWPTQATSITIASNSGPVDGTGGNGITSIQYAAAASGTFPAGSYGTYITYTATPTF